MYGSDDVTELKQYKGTYLTKENLKIIDKESISSKELTALEQMRYNCIVDLFDSKDKWYVLSKYLREAFQLGANHK